MAEFVIMIAILVICGLLFGKADTKKELLNQVGLDLSERNYDNKKGNHNHNHNHNHGVGSTNHAKTGVGQYVNIARFFVTHISFKNDAANIQKNNGNT